VIHMRLQQVHIVLFLWLVPIPALPITSNLTEVAVSAFETMMTYYVKQTGFFGDPLVMWPVWTSGNTFETLCNYFELTGDERVLPVLENSFSLVRSSYRSPYMYNDDIQWHAHAWLRAYQVTAFMKWSSVDGIFGTRVVADATGPPISHT